jgi:hypothetical protein
MLTRVFPATLAVLLAFPASASAEDAYGTLTLVQEWRAGFLEEVGKASGQVVVERDGETLAAERGMTVHHGDILVTARGSCVVGTAEGWQVTVGENSRVEVRTTWAQRLGTVIYRVRETFAVRVERVEVLVEGTVFRITWDGVAGEVAVTEGAVRVRGEGDVETVVRAGERAPFTATAPGESETLAADARSELVDQERLLGTPNGGSPSRAGRFRIGVGGGVAAAQDRTWGTARLRARIRLAGPLWTSVSGGLMLRPLAPEEDRVTLAFPLVYGLRVAADLPGGAVGALGGSLDVLLGERCIEPVDCERVVVAEPGGTLDLGVGWHIGRWLAVSVEGRFGASLRHEYGDTFQLEPDRVVSPRLGLAVWLEVRP